MNERYDPLGDYGGPAPAVVTSPKPPSTRKRPEPKPALVKAAVGVPDSTLAFLYTAGRNLEQNRENAAQIRADFIAFCQAHSHFTDWRQAWNAFIAVEKARFDTPHEIHGVKAPVAPSTWVEIWRRRLYRTQR